MIWVDLGKLNFAPGAPVMTLNPNNIDLTGDVTAKFNPGGRAVLSLVPKVGFGSKLRRTHV